MKPSSVKYEFVALISMPMRERFLHVERFKESHNRNLFSYTMGFDKKLLRVQLLNVL